MLDTTFSREWLQEKIEAVLRRVLDLDEPFPFDELSRDALPEWDSLRHVKLMMELQQELGIRFAAAEIVGAVSARAILEAVEAKRHR